MEMFEELNFAYLNFDDNWMVINKLWVIIRHNQLGKNLTLGAPVIIGLNGSYNHGI